MIPATSSISLTLNDMFTETEMEFIKDKDIKTAVEKEIKNGNYKDKFSNMTDLFYLNGELQDKVHTEKISKVVDLFRENRSQKVKISTTNNMPTAAGLSSSSSGLSAVIKACNELLEKIMHNLNLHRFQNLDLALLREVFWTNCGLGQRYWRDL